MEDASNQRLNWILIALLTLCGSVMVLAAWWYYASQREDLKSSTLTELTAIADVKAKQIANWRSERIGDGGVLSSAAVQGLARALLTKGTASATARIELQDVLQRFIGAFHYGGASLVDRNGDVKLEVTRSHVRRESYRATEAASSASGRVVLSDLYLDNVTGQPWMVLTVPVHGAGAMILDIDPSVFLYPYVYSWPTSSKTGETILARREGTDLIYLSEGKDKRGELLWQRVSVPTKMPRMDDLSSLQEWIDYRGVPVMGVPQVIPDSDWYLIAKIDANEASAPLRPLAWGMTLLIALIAATNAVGARLAWRNRQLRFYRDRETWFRQITNDTPAYLWMTSPGVERCFVNRRCTRLLGTNQDDVLWQDYVHPDDREHLLNEYSACLQTEADFRDEFRLRRFDGAYRWMLAQGLPRYVAGKFAGYAGVFSDVTERREAEQHLRSANPVLSRPNFRSERALSKKFTSFRPA